MSVVSVQTYIICSGKEKHNGQYRSLLYTKTANISAKNYKIIVLQLVNSGYQFLVPFYAQAIKILPTLPDKVIGSHSIKPFISI